MPGKNKHLYFVFYFVHRNTTSLDIQTLCCNSMCKSEARKKPNYFG